MKTLYQVYQVCIALPILLALTGLTAVITTIGSLFASPHFWGYYPGKVWSQVFCYLLLIPVQVKGRK
ncbi:MAG: 1-acyl-sn-glycerol-3-phosphate acyltransferase, partial [Bacteroidaceae bacterium]